MTGSSECAPDTCPVNGGFFAYLPSIAGNGVVLGGFAILIPLTLFLGIRYRAAIYTAMLITGLVLEVLCYVGRILLHGSIADRGYFVIFLLGSVLGPTFITAAIFYVLPRVMIIYDSSLVDIRPMHYNYLFFSLAFLALSLQAVGSVFAAIGSSELEILQGLRILMAGLGIHLAALVLFFCVYFAFLLKKSNRAGHLNPENAFVYESPRFRLFIFGWQLAAWFIFIRTVYRLAEVVSGLGSSLAQTEAAFMVLDGAQVLVACVILTVLHPGAAFGTAWNDKPEEEHQDYNIVHHLHHYSHHRSISPRRAPAPAHLPLVHSSHAHPYEQVGQFSPKNSPHNTSPGFSPKGYSPKFSPTSVGSGGGSGIGDSTISSGMNTKRTSGRSYYSQGGTSYQTGPSGAKRSPREPKTQKDMVDSEALW